MYTNILLLSQSETCVPPTHSRSGRPIEDHHPYTIFPLIGYDAPSVDVIAGRSKQVRKKVTKKTSRRVRTRIESADPPMTTSAGTLAVLPLPAAGEVDTQVITQAGAAAASLLVEAMQVNLLSHPADCHPHTDSSYFRLHKTLLWTCNNWQQPNRSSFRKPVRAQHQSWWSLLLMANQWNQPLNRG